MLLLLSQERHFVPWKLKLSTSTIQYSRLPVEEACARIAKLGFEAVDIWSAHAGCPHLDDVLDRLGPEGLKELLERNKLRLYTFSVYAGGYRKYAELLGKAGGGVAVRGSSGPAGPQELASRMKAFIEGLKPDLELAEKCEVDQPSASSVAHPSESHNEGRP